MQKMEQMGPICSILLGTNGLPWYSKHNGVCVFSVSVVGANIINKEVMRSMIAYIEDTEGCSVMQRAGS